MIYVQWIYLVFLTFFYGTIWYLLMNYDISGSYSSGSGSIPWKYPWFCIGCICPFISLEDRAWLPAWYLSCQLVTGLNLWREILWGDTFLTWFEEEEQSFNSHAPSSFNLLGTGHGVGAALNVHEGPQSISFRYGNMTPLQKGMIVSNEPGYYEDHAFGIRIEVL